jgi:hypothetical protein
MPHLTALPARHSSLFLLAVLFLCIGLTKPANTQNVQFVQVASFTPPLGSPPYIPVTGDLNHDGKLDLVLVSGPGTGTPSTAYVLLGNGDGTFAPAVGYPISAVGDPPAAQAVLVDFRGNGHLDLALSTGAVLLGNGDGTFQPFVSYGTNLGQKTGITAGDFNGDTKLDIGVADWQLMHGGNTGSLDVLLGQGDGTFAAPLSTALSPPVPETNFIASGDFNQDGKLDVAVGIGSFMQILLGQGNGSFQAKVRYTLGATVQDIVPADFNGDGIPDLAVSNSSSSSQVSIFLGIGDGTFQSPINFTVSQLSLAVSAADLNSDGKLDLLVANTSGFSLWLGNGDGTFSVGTTVPVNGVASSPSNISSGDFNNSGHPGVVVSNDDSVFVFLQGPLPTLGLSPTTLTFTPEAPGKSSAAQTVTLTNSGTAPLTVSGIAIGGANPASFTQTNNCTSPLAANASCQISVISTPDGPGSRSASLTITDNAPGTPQTVVLNGTGSDFALNVTSSTTTTVTPGQAANYAVMVSPISGFDQAVLLSCSGGPAHSTCTATPSSVTPGATANIAVVTPAASAGLTQPFGAFPTNSGLAPWTLFSVVVGLTFIAAGKGSRKGRSSLFYGLTIACLLCIGFTMSACGGGNSPRQTQPTTYTVTVTGTYTSGAASLSHNTTVTLVVQ